ncbi:phosphomannomutase/phosphoglucomutase [Clostridium sp. DJ247]|uniref:phosphomannomutase/phosphoglucomutase n=1 Tax=Clostridium sp. DJ247 TaxID=2726188 RepID=UPI001628BEC6|nr:phosphomannomutase/phosphoglucomutase [Clostridium sp. DJ247]MBC2579596.1 phosphomannomutase/phosphoglucomutase [Clostridium sp. DJ247]
MLKELHKLQNRTDVRGIAISYDEKQVNLTPDSAKLIAYGFLKWLEGKSNIKAKELKIAIGMDSRLSGPELKSCIIQELSSLECTVYDCGMSTTPAMFMTTVLEEFCCDGAIMITASHLPYYYNGLKFFTKQGGCEKEDIKSIIDIAVSKRCSFSGKGKVVTIDFIEEYSKVLVNMIRKGVSSKKDYCKPLSGFKIVIDAGNGAGGFFADKVLKTLGADISGSQFMEPDGRFPNHIPNPEAKEAMNSIREAVLKNNADLGIIFDADVDRAAIVDSNGREINKNALIALVSSIILEEHPKSIIVTDSVTSTGLAEFISNLGGTHHRFKRGYKNVINEAIKINNQGKSCHLAIETSGHAALKENYFLDDGAYLISKILVKMARLSLEGKKIESLIENLKIPYESLEFRITIKNDNFKEYGTNIIKELENYVEETEGWDLVANNYEGVRVACNKSSGNGWFLLRLSLHEPILALNIESDSCNGAKSIMDKLTVFLYRYDKLDVTNFK